MLPIGASVRHRDPFLHRIFGIGCVYEIWDVEKIQAHYLSTGSKKKPLKNEVWYRILFDESYQEEDGIDNLVTLGQDEIEEMEKS